MDSNGVQANDGAVEGALVPEVLDHGIAQQVVGGAAGATGAAVAGEKVTPNAVQVVEGPPNGGEDPLKVRAKAVLDAHFLEQPYQPPDLQVVGPIGPIGPIGGATGATGATSATGTVGASVSVGAAGENGGPHTNSLPGNGQQQGHQVAGGTTGAVEDWMIRYVQQHRQQQVGGGTVTAGATAAPPIPILPREIGHAAIVANVSTGVIVEHMLARPQDQQVVGGAGAAVGAAGGPEGPGNAAPDDDTDGPEDPNAAALQAQMMAAMRAHQNEILQQQLAMYDGIWAQRDREEAEQRRIQSQARERRAEVRRQQARRAAYEAGAAQRQADRDALEQELLASVALVRETGDAASIARVEEMMGPILDGTDPVIQFNEARRAELREQQRRARVDDPHNSDMESAESSDEEDEPPRDEPAAPAQGEPAVAQADNSTP